MNKPLEKMNIFELEQFKNILENTLEEYDKNLQTYSVLYDDKFFERITSTEKEIFDKKMNVSSILGKIKKMIEEIILKEYA